MIVGMPDPHRDILDIEAEIEALAAHAEQCWRVIALSRMVAAAGCLLLLTTLAGLLSVGPIGFVIGISATFGGIAVFGSNRSTRDQVMLKIKAREARRAQLIDGLRLKEVELG